PAASTLRRAVLLARLGNTMTCEPSLGVPAASVMGNVRPPFVERRIFTLAALTGALAVPATSHVTVCTPAKTPPLLCDVTRNGPAAVVTLTCISDVFTPPPPARLSRAVTRKFIVRVVVGITSPIASALTSRSSNRGKMRDGLVSGFQERKSGLLPLSGAVTV